MAGNSVFTQGFRINSQEPGFVDAIRAAVEYRGDVTLDLTSGEKLAGYLFSFQNGQLGLYPQESKHKRTIALEDLWAIHFTGADKASGKSWEAYQARKARQAKSAEQ